MKNQSGITLVALVITIIVLLILAGVSINLALGQNGVLTRASGAVAANERAKVLEELNMTANEAQTVYFENVIKSATYKKSTPYYVDANSNSKYDVFEHDCMGAKTLVLDTASFNENTGIITGVYQSDGSKLFYLFKINVDSGKVALLDKGEEDAATARGKTLANP